MPLPLSQAPLCYLRFNGAATLSLRKCQAADMQGLQAILASMGPQLYRCGNKPLLMPHLYVLLRFNGAATLSLRKFAEYTVTLVSERRLQWGRNFIVAEMWQHWNSYTLRVIRASMGPQLYRCGNQGPNTSSCIQNYTLQWGRNFIVAEICRIGDTLHTFDRLQWGRNFIVAEMGLGRCLQVGMGHASMGPQLYRCGNFIASIRRPTSISLLQWGRNFIVAEIGRGRLRRARGRRRFNGAATLSLRK